MNLGDDILLNMWSQIRRGSLLRWVLHDAGLQRPACPNEKLADAEELPFHSEQVGGLVVWPGCCRRWAEPLHHVILICRGRRLGCPEALQ